MLLFREINLEIERIQKTHNTQSNRCRKTATACNDVIYQRFINENLSLDSVNGP